MAASDRQPARTPSRGKSAREILNVRAEVSKHRSNLSRVTDRIGAVLAHPLFFTLLASAHLLWVALNLPIAPWRPWDPFPFTLLATIASVEAPFIALLVLMYQERNSRINELREETNLQVALHIERELTMALRLLNELEERLRVKSRQNEDELVEMRENLDPRSLFEQIRRHLGKEEGGSRAERP